MPVILLLAFLSKELAIYAQAAPTNQYGLVTISSIQTYHQLIAQDSSLELIAVKDIAPGIVLDMRYAGSNNFMKQPMYKKAEAYLSRPAAVALASVERELNKMGYGLKIWDAYRPYAITLQFYEKVKDSIYVASPYSGSRHNRGCAVDLTLIHLATGRELAMPTPFDDFTEKANAGFMKLPAKVIKNRELLKKAMTAQGFNIYPGEWWHFDFRGWKKHPLMDIALEDL